MTEPSKTGQKFLHFKKRHLKQIASRDRVIESLRNEIAVLENKKRKTALYAKKVKSDAHRYHKDYEFLYNFWKKHKDCLQVTEQEIKNK